jgi:YesN/AraC family two-component response regulator
MLSNINEVSPLIKTVMVSAYGDMDNIRSAMNKGAFDFVCKPVNFNDLELTIEKTLKQVEQVKETLKAIKENNILKMYVDETVLKFMNHREYEKSLLSNETIDATIVFIDICRFTSLTENQSADKVISLLNEYFDLMVKEILAQVAM